MLGISCLTKNTALQTNLKDLVEYLGYSQVAANKDAGFSSVYNIIRQSGIEVDMNTVGHIYNEVLPKTYKQFSSDEHVNERVLKNYNDAIRRASLLEEKTGEKQIREDSPEDHVVNGILNMFTNAEVADETTKSDMLKLQDALWKGVQRKLNLKEDVKPKTNEQWKDVLNKALGYEQVGVKDVNGKLNGIADLYEAMKKQLAEAGKDLIRKGEYSEVQRWFDMTNDLEASTYSLLFSKGEAKDLLDGIMKESGFGKELANGKTILNWNKLAGGVGDIQDLRNNVDNVLSKNGFSNDVIEGVKNSLENEFNELLARTAEKRLKQLDSRQNSIGRTAEQKSDLKRLSELNNLGIFNGSYEKLLNNILGVPDLQQQDIQDLHNLANAASELYREVDKELGSNIFASRHLQTIQRSIDSIIARNINNKTRTLKVVSNIKAFMDVMLTGLLMRPFTILENLYSGIKEVLVPTVMGKGLNKEDVEIYRKMLSDVAIRGQAFGEEIGNFSPQELYTNTLKWKWKGGTAKEKGNSIIHAIMIPGRIGLMGFDSANKVVITNKVFNNAIYQALTQNGKSKEDATKLMNEALYGENFEKSKERAKEMIEKVNTKLPDKYKIPVNSRTITTFANDLVKHNLNANGALTNEVIEAAYKSSYHVAGYGLGHEANNTVSSAVRGYRTKRKQEEDRLIKEKDWNKVAMHRLKDTYTNGMILRFIGGATNWVYLRAQANLGLGLATGFLGNWNGDIDFADKKTIQASIKDIQGRRNMIARSVVGLSSTAIAYMIGFALYRNEGEDKDKKARLTELQKRKIKLSETRADSGESGKKYQKIKSLNEEIKSIEAENDVMKRIRANWMQSRLFKKMAPDAMLFHYYANTDKNMALAIMDYVQTTTNFGGSFSTSSKMAEASKLYYRGDIEAGNGQVGSILADYLIPTTPTWQAYKDWGKLGDWITGGNPKSDFKKPSNFVEGTLGGGMFEDLGLYNRNPNITTLPGIGGRAYEKFKENGIENMEDLKKHDNWWKMKDKNGDYILDATDRIKAKDAADRYFEQ